MKLKRTHIAAALAAVAVLAGTQAAFAAATLSVDGTTSPAGPVSTSMTTGTPETGYIGPIEFESNMAVVGECSAGNVGGYLLRGASGTVGTKIGAITDMYSSACTLTAFLFDVGASKMASPTEWTIHIAEAPASGARYIHVEIRNINMRMNPAGPIGTWPCAIALTGTLPAKIDTATDRLIIDTLPLAGTAAFPLDIDALDGWGNTGGATWETCGYEFQDGDLMSVKGTFRLDHDISAG